jgi:Asp-tRNA(Asn)/Glu-tRNA(Gln) amidotransferase A subunit family amidase
VLVLAESLDHVGPMARRVADVAIMFDAIAGVDPEDPTSLRDPVPNMAIGGSNLPAELVALALDPGQRSVQAPSRE